MSNDSILYGRLEPCQTANPSLWRRYCRLTRRDPLATAEHWTERDVMAAMAERLRLPREVLFGNLVRGERHDPS